MRDLDSDRLHEVPGGAHRADTFLLVVVTILAAVVVPGVRHDRTPVIPLLGIALWLQILARWLRHVRPRHTRAIEYLGALALGAALYAGWAGR